MSGFKLLSEDGDPDVEGVKALFSQIGGGRGGLPVEEAEAVDECARRAEEASPRGASSVTSSTTARPGKKGMERTNMSYVRSNDRTQTCIKNSHGHQASSFLTNQRRLQANNNKLSGFLNGYWFFNYFLCDILTAKYQN